MPPGWSPDNTHTDDFSRVISRSQRELVTNRRSMVPMMLGDERHRISEVAWHYRQSHVTPPRGLAASC
jgi:hypothetical protein